jgi:hypothetical protein
LKLTNKVLLNGISRSARHEVIASLSEVIPKSSDWIDDVQFFSKRCGLSA